MKIYDIRIAISQGEGKTFWKTIGTIFCGDNARIEGKNGKPATFVIDFPAGQGIIVRRKSEDEKKADKEKYEQNKSANSAPSNDDNSAGGGVGDLPDDF
jgi:hypothetical protein